MNIFEGKSPAEKKKLIAAAVLGTLALLSLIYTFGGMFGGSKKTTTVNVTVTPTPTPATAQANNDLRLPNQDQINEYWLTTPVSYNPSSFFAPDAGRNIFAFYEPPPPAPPSQPILITDATPTPAPPLPTPTPAPPPTVIIGFITPQNVYAGSKGFRLEVNGDKFTPETYIFFNGVQIPTNYVSPQKLTADIPADLIAGAGIREIEVRSPDGKLFSSRVQMNVQAAPRPQFQYIGMIARRSYNNDTAYFQDSNKPTPFGARLNDIIGGRFRLVSISSAETVFEDTSLGFRYRLPLYRPAPGQTSTSAPNETRTGFPEGFPQAPGFQNYNPQMPQGNPPGIPQNIKPYSPPQQPPQQKKANDDEDDDGIPDDYEEDEGGE